jgi:hypothetical protein
MPRPITHVQEDALHCNIGGVGIAEQQILETVVSLVALQNNFCKQRKPEKKNIFENFWKPFRTFHTLETRGTFHIFFLENLLNCVTFSLNKGAKQKHEYRFEPHTELFNIKVEHRFSSVHWHCPRCLFALTLTIVVR